MPDGEKAFKEHQRIGKETASEALYSAELPMAQSRMTEARLTVVAGDGAHVKGHGSQVSRKTG